MEQPPSQFPGYGLPLSFVPTQNGHPFPTALDSIERQPGSFRMPILTLREIKMLLFMNKITDEPEWHINVFNTNCTDTRKQQVINNINEGFSPEMADYCIAELQYKAQVFQQLHYVTLYHGDVVKSDIVVSSGLRQALAEAAKALENDSAHKDDWRPGSGGHILNLLDPSLYSLIYGVSRTVIPQTIALESCLDESIGRGSVIPVRPMTEAIETEHGMQYQLYSQRFQWLPFEVDISKQQSRITSYINNLHPHRHSSLYKTIEDMIDLVLPLWDATLAPLGNPPFERRIEVDEVDYGELDRYAEAHVQKQPDEDVGDYEQRLASFKNAHRRRYIVQPNPPPFEQAQPQESLSLRSEYHGLQIYAELINVYLTPEKPVYEEGNWHAEGQRNEHVCATAMYCYEKDNIAACSLSFRQASDNTEPVEHVLAEEDDLQWATYLYGIRNDEPTLQNVGGIEIREGRLVTYPNILQRRAPKFKLENPRRPGHLKILALFLVDPHLRVISTAHISCQQKEWWGGAIVDEGADVRGRLPLQLWNTVFNGVSPLSLDDAKVIREVLRRERAPGGALGYQAEKWEDHLLHLEDGYDEEDMDVDE